MTIKIFFVIVLLFFVYDGFVGQIPIKQVSAETEQTNSKTLDDSLNSARMKHLQLYE